jgi:xanthine dehydrogenase accessory factor
VHGGAGRNRIVHAPSTGWFATSRRIGDRVHAGEVVGVLGSLPVAAPMAGVLRGLAARGARIREGDELVEVDPRGDPALCFGISPRESAIARGVVAALACPSIGRQAAVTSEPVESGNGTREPMS